MTLDTINFYQYIYRVLKQTHPGMGLTGNSLSSLNNMIKIVIEKMMSTVNKLMIRTKKKTVSSREIHFATKLIIPENMREQAISAGMEAVGKYNLNKEKRKSERHEGSKLLPVSRSSMAGIVFPVTRIQHIMMDLSISTRKTGTAAVYLAAVCEYIVSELLELSGNAARDNKRARIIPRHIMLVVKNDPDLNKLYSDTIFSGGILPHINLAILPRK